MSMLLPSEGVKDILVAGGVGVFAPQSTGVPGEWVIEISRLKSEGQQQICVLDGPGATPEPGLNIEYPSVQVLVRGGKDQYKATWLKALAVKDALLGKPTAEMGLEEDVWAGISMEGDMMFLGYDENERPTFSLNFALIVHRGSVIGTYRDDF